MKWETFFKYAKGNGTCELCSVVIRAVRDSSLVSEYRSRSRVSVSNLGLVLFFSGLGSRVSVSFHFFQVSDLESRSRYKVPRPENETSFFDKKINDFCLSFFDFVFSFCYLK